MKKRKILSLFICVAMIMTFALPVFAEDKTDITETTVTEDASVNYVNPAESIRLVVPTSAALGFTLDPQNLAATQGVGDWDPDSGGSILPHAVGTVVNRSAVPVKTSVSFTLTDNSDTPVTLVADDTDINEGTDKKMYMTITPANAKTTIDADEIPEKTEPVFVGETPVTFTAAELTAAGVEAGDMLAHDAGATANFGQFVETGEDSGEYNQVEVAAHATVPATTATTTAEYNTSLADETNEVVLSASGAVLAYAIDRAEYYVRKEGSDFSLVYREEDLNDNYDTASFIIGGKINKNADWSDYTGETKITLSAEYNFEIMSVAEFEAADILDQSHNSIEAPSGDLAPTYYTGGDITVTTSDTTISVPFNLGTGELAVTIESIELDAVGDTFGPVEHTYVDGNIIFTDPDSDGFITFILNTPETYPFRVTTSDTNVASFNIVVTP